jgi:hypothetical protein
MATDHPQNTRTVETVQRNHVRMLAPDVARQLRTYHSRFCFQEGHCLLRLDDQGPLGHDPPLIPHAPFERARLHTGTRESGSYNHHSQVAAFRGRYYFAWSNGRVDEEAPGQRILISSSADARHWSAPSVVVGSWSEPTMAHNCVALVPSADVLYCVSMHEDATVDATATGMRRIDPESHQVEAFASVDAVTWEPAFRYTDELKWLFERPRPLADGGMMCVGCLKSGPCILRWPDERICQHPEIISIPEPDGAVFPYGEGSWYQTDDGTVVVFWRDEGGSCRIWVNTSTDGGVTFSAPTLSDIPDSMSRNSAGRLADGRFFLCNNAFPTLLNRMHLILLLSDGGYEFNQVYVLCNEPTSQRVVGLLKADGHQYPSCWPDGDRLLVGHSVNKEDICCGIVDLSRLRHGGGN